jgi:hypothetical protein
MIEHTFLGSLADKNGSSGFTIPDVTVSAEEALVTVVAYETNYEDPIISWNGEGLPLVGRVTGGGINLQINSRPEIGGSAETDDLTVSWSESPYPSYKVLIACKVTEINVYGSRVFTDVGITTDPDSGEGSLPGVENLILFGATVAKGPNTDNLGTIQGGYDIDYSIGTDNETEEDNLFLHAFCKIVTSPEKPRAYKIGASERYHLAATCVFRKGSWQKIGMSPSDIVYAYTAMVMRGHDIEKHALFFNQDTDAWELRANVDYSNSILVSRNTADQGWVDEA